MTTKANAIDKSCYFVKRKTSMEGSWHVNRWCSRVVDWDWGATIGINLSINVSVCETPLIGICWNADVRCDATDIYMSAVKMMKFKQMLQVFSFGFPNVILLQNMKRTCFVAVTQQRVSSEFVAEPTDSRVSCVTCSTSQRCTKRRHSLVLCWGVNWMKWSLPVLCFQRHVHCQAQTHSGISIMWSRLSATNCNDAIRVVALYHAFLAVLLVDSAAACLNEVTSSICIYSSSFCVTSIKYCNTGVDRRCTMARCRVVISSSFCKLQKLSYLIVLSFLSKFMTEVQTRVIDVND